MVDNVVVVMTDNLDRAVRCEFVIVMIALMNVMRCKHIMAKFGKRA